MSKDTQGETDGLPYSPLGLFSAQQIEDFMHSLVESEFKPLIDDPSPSRSSSHSGSSSHQSSLVLDPKDSSFRAECSLQERRPSESPSSRVTEQSSNCTQPSIQAQHSQHDNQQKSKALPSLLPIPYFVPLTPVPYFTDWTIDTNCLDRDQKVPLPILFPGDCIKYAWGKQAERIHKLRVKRLLGKLPVYVRGQYSKKLCYEKRSAHAKKRLRAPNGQFYSKAKENKMIKRDKKAKSKQFQISLLQTEMIESEEKDEESQLHSLMQDISEVGSARESSFSLKKLLLDQ